MKVRKEKGVMRSFKIVIISSMFLLLGCSVLQAKTSVWEVSKGNNKLYLGGTIHVLGEQDYPLPCEYQLAYEESEKVIFETDFSVISTPAFSQQLVQAGLYPEGQSIGDKLSPKTLQSLTLYLGTLGLPVQNLMQFKPVC